MKVIVIIQARMGSSRLPGKILLPLGKNDVLSYVTSRCKQFTGVYDVIVATSTLEVDDVVEQWCRDYQISCYRGSESDVLDRFIQAAKPYSPDYVVRVTADCPFVDIDMASSLIELATTHNVDIVDINASMLPRGFAAEVISYKALCYIHEKGDKPYHREHVTYYAYENRSEFSRIDYTISPSLHYPHLRVTLDTAEDYEVISAIAQAFESPNISSDQVVQYLLSHPHIASINAEVQQKPVL